jgi:hypothetical protein
MKDVEDRRLSLIFDATEKANQILGRSAANHQVVSEIFDFGRGD